MNSENKRSQMSRKIVERLLLGEGVNEICRTMRVGKHRVMKIRDAAIASGYLDGKVALPAYPIKLFPELIDRRTLSSSDNWKSLDGHTAWIKERLEAGWHRVTVFEELTKTVSVTVPRSSFYRFLTHHNLSSSEARRVIPEIIHQPGEALLLDWGYLWSVTHEGKRKKLWVFAGVLGFSRFMTAKVMLCCDQVNTLHAIAAMFEEFGGVTTRTTSDNPKVFTLVACKYEPILNPVYERFAAHYGTIVEALPPRDPEKKGKVERPIPYLRRLFESYAGDLNDLSAIQKHLDERLIIANARVHGTTRERPIERFEAEEKSQLKPLPPLTYQIEHYHEGMVRRDGHVRFQNKYYSLDEKFIDKNVIIIGGKNSVEIFYNGALVEVHSRVTSKYVSKSTKPQHLKPWEAAMSNPDGLRGEAAKIGFNTELLILEILRRGKGFIDQRKIWGILSFAKKYPSNLIESACAFALLINSPSYQVVKKWLVEHSEISSTEENSKPLPTGKFQRSPSVYSDFILQNKKQTIEKEKEKTNERPIN